MSSVLGCASLGASTFCAQQHGAEECDNKGLPLTPNSINIVGRFQALLELDHPGLCAYLDIIRTRNERLLVVSEWYEDCAEKHIESKQLSNVDSLRKLAWQVLEALSYLNHHDIIHHSLAPDTILLTPQGDAKLHNYGLYYMTECGKAVKFPIGSPRHLPPEVIMSSLQSPSVLSPKVDVWSLGIILLELYLGTPIYPDLTIRNSLTNLFKRLLLLIQNYHSKGVHPLTGLMEMEKHKTAVEPMPSELGSFLEACLSPLPSQRPSPADLLSHPFITDMANTQTKKNGLTFSFLPSPFKQLRRCQGLDFDLPTHTHNTHTPHQQHIITDDHLAERRLCEVYYLWSLAGGDVETELRKRGLISSTPPICSLPCLVTTDREGYGTGNNRVSLYDNTVLPLSLDQLQKRLEGMSTADYYPLIESSDEMEPLHERHESSSLPLAIKEKDIEYQFHRMVMFTRLLESYPHSQPRIVMEAVVDVCPLVRAEVWAALLGVKGDIQEQYTSIDKDSEGSADRQIDVDIPRCHQYNTLLASRDGHRKFKRILKAWVVSHHKLVYWQGLDSLCAPFLALNFNNEALALACLSAFISKYLHDFFLKDNSAIMQEYLAVFSQMIAFHEPELYNHLDSIAFHPELYAIPWFLTMFTHILPLHKIYHLWDTLLLGNCSFPLFIGVSILQHLKDDLLSFDFNECILMFSDMPGTCT
jgi:TBC domain-containing protein kinase-like protein